MTVPRRSAALTASEKHDQQLDHQLEETARSLSNGEPKVKAKQAASPKVGTPIHIPMLQLRTFELTVVGDSSLVVHAWSEKAKSMIRATQQKKGKQAREPKNPEADFEGSLYRLEDGSPGFPALAFKNAAVDACSHIDGVTKVEARGAFHVLGDMVRIEGDPPVMREDMVRVGMGAADIRYRGEFKQWRCKLTIRHNINVLSAEQIVNLFNVAGFAIGVGEHRPQRDGNWGMFHVS